MISTHSDYIIRELNNLIMLKSKPNFAKKYNYADDTLLTHSKVGAILFHYNTRKSVALEVTETGFEVETYNSLFF